MTQGPNAFRIPRMPKEDEDRRHSPRENKDTSNMALATPHEDDPESFQGESLNQT